MSLENPRHNHSHQFLPTLEGTEKLAVQGKKEVAPVTSARMQG